MIAPQFDQEFLNTNDLIGIEADGRLVEDQNLRLVNQRTRQAYPLTKALGQRSDHLATYIAEQAAVEVGSQLPDHAIDVVLASGQPTLVVRSTSDLITVNTDDCAARITVRLPEDLKEDLESAASDTGDSVNTFVVRTLAGRAKASKVPSKSLFKGLIET